MPPTLVTNDPEAARAFYDAHGGQVICKSLRHHYIETPLGILHEVFAHRIREEDLNGIGTVQLAPAIFQAYITAAREIRVTAIGESVFAVELTNKGDLDDWHRIGTANAKLRPIDLPEEVKFRCLAFLRAAGLDYGSFDILHSPADGYFSLEVNPIADWHWIELHSGLPITEAVLNYLLLALRQSVNHASSSEP